MANLSELLSATRSDLDESSASFWTDAELIRWINIGQSLIMQKAVAADEDYMLTSTPFSIAASTDTYLLPQNTLKVRRIEQIFPSDTSRIPVPFYPIHLNQKGLYDVAPSSLGSVSLDNSFRYFLNTDSFVLIPTPSTNAAGTNNGKVWFIPRLGDLHYATATTAASTTITFPSTATYGTPSRRDDYYNEMFIEIVSGTGIGQIRKISDYVGSTRVATISNAWTTTPDSTSVYSILSPIPEEFHILFVKYAVIQAQTKDEADNSQNRVEFERLLAQFIVSIEARQTQEPDYVNYVPDDYSVY